jgi:hypothetical protein
MTLSDSLYDRLSVIIRSAGERTESLCKELVLETGLQERNITVIKENPFSRALYASYETGIALDRPWTLCLDADVLVLADSIHEMICFAEKQHPSVFEIQGLILDKFFGGPRQAGFHLYRTSLLSQAIKLIPLTHETIRPEHYTLDAMKGRGFPWKRMDYLVGIHDFEQYYADIFRKTFAQAHKHQEYAEIFLTYWPRQGINDFDYKVAVKGLMAGLEYEGEVWIDSQQEIYKEQFEKFKVIEKLDLPSGYFSPSDIELLVKNWIEPSIYHKYFKYEIIANANDKPKHSIRKKNLSEKRKALGVLKFLVYLLGWAFERTGSNIKGLVEKQEGRSRF